MLTAIELENFKAFGERTRIELAPITLIFGENSAGKSSILQSLNLLKQTIESKERGTVFLPRSGKGIVDLGSYQELVFKRETDKEISVKLEMDKEFEEKRSEFGPLSEFVHYIEMCYGMPSGGREVQLARVELGHGRLGECDSQENLYSFKAVEESDDETMIQSELEFADEISTIGDKKSLKLKCDFVSKSFMLWDEFHGFISANKNLFFTFLEDKRAGLNSEGGSRDVEKELKYIEEIIHFYEKYMSDAEKVKERLRKTQEGLVRPYDTFLSDEHIGRYFIRRSRHRSSYEEEFLRDFVFYKRKCDHTYDKGDNDGSNYDVLRNRSLITQHLLHSFTSRTIRLMNKTLSSLFPMGPFRRPPERYYLYSGTMPIDVGYEGELLPDLLFRQEGLVKETNKWLEKLEIGYELDVKQIGYSEDLFEVRLVDTRGTGVKITLSDVGFGVSQLLPFIVQSLATKKKIISIEQPEVHVHPRLQADIGDLLAEASKKRGHQFLVETHSEHLILRLQKLIREEKLKPEDVSVIYVSREEDGSQAQRLQLDNDGRFIDDWPGGFFPERRRELI